MKLPRSVLALSLALASFAPYAHAQVPQLINYQGRVAVGSANFDGIGLFKFALVNGTGTTTYWSNDGSSMAGDEPSASVSVPVNKGLYSVLLGSSSLANMQPVPSTVFSNPDVHLRVWFNDGANGSQRLTPDQRIAAVGYALVASTAETARAIADGVSITAVNASFSGKIGIGTNDLISPVTVKTFTGDYGVTHTDGTHRISTYVDGDGAQIGTVSNHPLGLYAADSAYQLIVYPGGNVGIGTAPTPTPAERLTVIGAVQATQFVGDGSRLTGINGGAGNFGNNTNQAAAGVGRQGTIGEIVLSAGIRANGLPCNGQLLPISQYNALFSLLGTLYGGDGITTFGLPDLRPVTPNGLTYSIITNGVFPMPP